MKRLLILLSMLTIIIFGVYAQVDSTAIAGTTSNVLEGTWSFVETLFSENTWTIVFVGAFVLSEVLPYIKWTPNNNVIQTIWSIFKNIVGFLARKKK